MYKHIEENFRSKLVFCSSVDFATVIAYICWLFTNRHGNQNHKQKMFYRNSWLFEVYSSGDLVTYNTQAN